MLNTIRIQGYRSLRDFEFRLGRITLVTGGNGTGKSNLYRALGFVQKMAEGRFAESVAAEGGMPDLLWAGERPPGPVRISWEIGHEDFHYSMDCGLVQSTAESETAFRTDPEIKEERIRFGGVSGKVVAKRKVSHVVVWTDQGEKVSLELPLHVPESMLAEIKEGERYPALSAVRQIICRWRFYHHFRVDAASPIRLPQVGYRSPVLSHDGTNLASTLKTILEHNDPEDRLSRIIAQAFPDLEWNAQDANGNFQLQISRHKLNRPLAASELSDGTLRFFCLCAALLSPEPAPLVVLNEPEASLHESLLPYVAELISMVPAQVQLLIVTHSKILSDEIEAKMNVKQLELTSRDGATCLLGNEGSRRVWSFEE